MIRALVALTALTAISAVPASAAQCARLDGSFDRLLATVDALVGTSLSVADGELCEPVSDPTPDPVEPVIPNDPADPVLEPEPRAEDLSAPGDQPEAIPGIVDDGTTEGTSADAMQKPSERPRAGRQPEQPIALGPIVPAGSDAVPVGVATGLITATIVGAVAALLGRRRGRRAAYAHAGALLELIDDAVLVADARGTVTMANAVASALIGTQPRGLGVGEVFAGTDADGAPLGRTIASTHAPATISGALVAGDESIPVRVAVSPIGGRCPAGRAIVIKDMREHHRLESLKTEILANVGHELRTPLTSALGFARLAATRELGPEKTKAFVAAVVESCERLERVIDLLVDAATVEAGKAPTTVDRVRIVNLVGERVQRIEGRAASHVFAVRTTGRARALAGNRALLAHAIDELLDNAIKFSPDGGLITVHVTDAGESVEISVADQGIGIADEHLDRLWGDFQQVDASTTRRFGGLGLGLAFVRRVVRAHGGSIVVDSEFGSGSTFKITLPVRAVRRIDEKASGIGDLRRGRPAPVA